MDISRAGVAAAVCAIIVLSSLPAVIAVPAVCLSPFSPPDACTFAASEQSVGSFLQPRSPGAPGPQPSPNVKVTTVTFPANSFLIPFDAHQADIVKAFGFVHAVLRNKTLINRIIEPIPPPGPSDISIKTAAYPSGADFSGGPILILPGGVPVVNAIKPLFPTVTVDLVAEQFTSNRVYTVETETKILVIKGAWGKTEFLLSDMEIPFKLKMPSEILLHPEYVHEFNLIVDDCPGTGLGSNTSACAAVRENLTEFVNNGNELIFTDNALYDFGAMPWSGKLTPVQGVLDSIIINSTFHNIADFPGQYAGDSIVRLWQMGNSALAKDPAPDVYVMADCSDYPGQSETIVVACYFYWGEKSGIVEFFAYHPWEQKSLSYNFAAFLYGNKFLHTTPPDAGIFPRSGSGPSEIDQRSTGTLPSEQATINLSVQALKADITPENKATLNYELMPHIDYVTGSFSRDPASIIINPNGSKSLKWIVANVPSEQYWNVTFKITSGKAGDKVWINAAGRSNLTYIDFEGAPRVHLLLPLWIQVRGLPAPEGAAAALIFSCGAVLAACSVAALRGRRKGRL